MITVKFQLSVTTLKIGRKHLKEIISLQQKHPV